jgi:hypothetical protein
VLALEMARLSGFTRSQLCARHGVQAVAAVMGICRTHTTIVEGGGHGSASERTTGLAEIGEKPRRGPYFRCKAQITPCDLISCLSGTRVCLNARDRDLCHFAAFASIVATEVCLCRPRGRGVSTYISTRRRNVKVMECADQLWINCVVGRLHNILSSVREQLSRQSLDGGAAA